MDNSWFTAVQAQSVQISRVVWKSKAEELNRKMAEELNRKMASMIL